MSNGPISTVKPAKSGWNDTKETKTFSSDLRKPNDDKTSNSATLPSQIGSPSKRIDESNGGSGNQKIAVFENALFDMKEELERLKTEIN